MDSVNFAEVQVAAVAVDFSLLKVAADDRRFMYVI
jgi:hypothetical protein